MLLIHLCKSPPYSWFASKEAEFLVFFPWRTCFGCHFQSPFSNSRFFPSTAYRQCAQTITADVRSCHFERDVPTTTGISPVNLNKNTTGLRLKRHFPNVLTILSLRSLFGVRIIFFSSKVHEFSVCISFVFFFPPILAHAENLNKTFCYNRSVHLFRADILKQTKRKQKILQDIPDCPPLPWFIPLSFWLHSTGNNLKPLSH